MKRIVGIAVVTGCVLLLSFALASLCAHLIGKMLGENASLITAVSAFVGAFFSFVFVRLGEFLSELYKRENRHHNALVKLEHYFNNDYLNVLTVNKSILRDFAASINKTRMGIGIYTYESNLKQLPLDKNVVLDLANIQLINMLIFINVQIERLNNDYATISKNYERLTERFVQDRRVPTEKGSAEKEYRGNLEDYSSTIDKLGIYTAEVENEASNVLSAIRILLKQKPLFVKMLGCVHRNDSALLNEKSIAEERKVLEKEIAENIAKGKNKHDATNAK